jgi:cobalt-zinc-cadmium resistance protein CzcA
MSEKLKEAETLIPKGVGLPELAPISTGLGEIYQYVLFAEKDMKHSTMQRSSGVFRIGL